MSLQDKVGMQFELFTFEIERGKIKEFALAVGDSNPQLQTGEALPPTFATVMEMWGGPGLSRMSRCEEYKGVKNLYQIDGIAKRRKRINMPNI
jgi:hypothetical protein